MVARLSCVCRLYRPSTQPGVCGLEQVDLDDQPGCMIAQFLLVSSDERWIVRCVGGVERILTAMKQD